MKLNKLIIFEDPYDQVQTILGSIMDDKNWWSPANLIKKELEVRNKEKINDMDEENDFGTYRKSLAEGDITKTKASLHNDINPHLKIQQLCKRLKNIKPQKILDVGCGLGYTTEAIGNYFPQAEVLGIDISHDAIAYAENKFEKAKFMVFTLSPESEQIGLFDLIFCFEFYPFTRNNNTEIQLMYIEYMMKQLKENGEIVIYQKWDNTESLSVTYKKLQILLQNATIEVKAMPVPKISTRIIDAIGIPISILLGYFLKKELLRRYFVITHKKRD